MAPIKKHWLAGVLLAIWNVCTPKRFSRKNLGESTTSSDAPGAGQHPPACNTTDQPAAGKSTVRTDPTEPENHDVPQDERDIVIGLDFGTSCTKAVIGDDVVQAAYAVPFGDFAQDGYPFLLPARLFVERDGTMGLGAGEYRITGLKSKILEDPHRRLRLGEDTAQMPTALELCVGYLAPLLSHKLHANFS